MAHAAPQRLEQLPRVLITSKSHPLVQKVVQLPCMLIEGRSHTLMALNTKTQSVARLA